MDVRKISRIVIYSTTAALIAYDIWADSTGVRHGTLSGVIWDWNDNKYFNMGVGVLLGHFFWQSNEVYKK